MGSLLWCGGEDVDFPNGSGATYSTNSTFFRSGYARVAVQNSNSNTTAQRGNSFAVGAVTSCWLHAYFYCQNATNTSSMIVGLGLNSAGQVALAIGSSDLSATKICLWKFSGGSWTKLASEAGNTMVSGTGYKVDVQVQNFGAAATVTVYVNGVSIISYSGSTAVTGVSNLDCVCIPGAPSSNYYTSEFIVTDTLDTRAMSVVTHAPNAAGDSAGSWTNTYTSINPTSINDANAIYNNATGSDFQANLIDLPSGSFSVVGCKAIARAEVTAGATPTGFKLGVKTGGTINVDTGHTPGAAFTPFERLMLTNPVTSAAWTAADLNALQLDVQSM